VGIGEKVFKVKVIWVQVCERDKCFRRQWVTEALCFPSVCPSVRLSVRYNTYVMRYGWISVNTDVHHVSGIMSGNVFKVRDQKVEVICIQMCECDNGGDIHFVEVYLLLSVT